ncbi:centrosomal protein of 162 kDa isoform X2 [Bufo gargarizans]|uniref:centrosomal protein of 162 kDa isoform X2 n=1 Tax=Bufo gargarizans TaxID=30331 RepID=UPI001CF0EAD0|nr:centrosomal protein of 162 kDa isoform X2 [Bufo gargarizans]
MALRVSKEDLDEQFEQFLKESLSDDSFDSNKKSVVLENLGKPKVTKTKKKTASPWWMTEDDSDDGELARTSRSFVKSQSMSQPIEEVEEEEHVEEMQKSIDPLIASIEKDSLEIDDSVVASGPNQAFHGVGLDTLEEQEEKERFFARLEKGASSTIDYSKLIKELDSTDSTQLTTYMRNKDHAPADEDEHKDESKDVSVNYSEDFEDEPEANSHLVQKPEESDDLMEIKSQTRPEEEEKHGMLAKVVLIDSMDSTIDTQKILQQRQDEIESVMPHGTHEAMGSGISNQYTNSDMEALHQAYQNLEASIKGAEEQNTHPTIIGNTGTLDHHGINSQKNSLNKALAGDSDLSTVDELMQRIRGEEGFILSSVNMHVDKGVLPYTLHKAVGKDLSQSLPEEPVSQDLHNSHGEKTSEVFLAHEFDNHFKGEQKISTKDLESRGQSTEPNRSEINVMYSGERSGQADKCGSDLSVSAASSAPFYNKHPSKMIKSPPSSLKKGQSHHYSHVKSSGYGKINIQIKRMSDDDGSISKELHTDIKWKSPTERKQKGVLSAAKSIRFAENAIRFPRDKVEHQDSAAQVNIVKAKDTEKLSVPVGPNGRPSEIHYSDVSGNNLTILQRLQNVEEKINAAHGQTITVKEDPLRKEQEFKQDIEQLKINYEKEIKELKQENFLLQTKLHAGEGKIKKRSHLLGDQNAPITEGKIQQIRQEILEQETLLHGYQQENERLYNQVKELQVKNKQNEEQMFQENQALKAELISVREKVTSVTLHGQYAGTDANSSKDLAAELSAIQKRESNLLEDIARFKKDKQALEVDLLQMKKERDLLKGQLANISDDKSYEMKIMEETNKKEIARLNKRLHWFAENQDIMDKDAGRLKDAYEQIETLKIQVEKLQHDSGSQSVQQQNRVKDRAADAKRIQDLERQVKEMEAIIRRRHPNSIPALMFAAASVSETDKPSKNSTVSFLERRIQKLENDLESKDEEAKKSLRSMEQNFQKVKIQYESRINELEELLAQGPRNEPQKSRDYTVKVKALEQELSIFKDAHHTTVINLQKEIEVLKAKNLVLEHKLMLKEGYIESNSNVEETSDQARLTRLNQELVSKSKEIQELSRTVERLQKERMMMLSLKTHSSTVRNENGRTDCVLPPPSTTEKENFPAILEDNLYQPYTFTDVHISDLQQQNKRLEAEVLKLSQDLNQQITHYKTSLVNAEYTSKRIKEEAAEQVAALKQSHQREMERLICQQALEHSSSRVAELSSKISTQEIHIKHLQKQVVDLQKDRETLAVSRIREETLQKEMANLFEELKMAKECHSPEMRHFLTLESKIKHMEIRHSQREQELQQIIDRTRHVAEAAQVKEVEKWKRLVQQKNTELEKFRTELDAILDVLRMLQKQGVVIPTSASEASEIY